ncbi:hypothetical protein A8B78_21605 [Jannaschia sp. EhC01]|nr:hypothetical protein A8B78_21605 [Jannaschia sp. EhC01]
MMAALVLVAAIAFALSPVFTEPFSGFDPSQLPRPVDDPPIQPAGYAFAIWGVIYLWLIAGAAYGLIKRADAPDWQAMRPALLLSLVIGATWIPVALAAPVPATLLIIAMLLTALIALFRAPRAEALWSAAPIALYAGWLSAASVVASATVVAAYTGLSPQGVSLGGILLVAFVAGAVVRTTHHPIPYAAAVIWALAGIVFANLASGLDTVGITAMAVIAGLAFATVKRMRALS